MRGPLDSVVGGRLASSVERANWLVTVGVGIQPERHAATHCRFTAEAGPGGTCLLEPVHFVQISNLFVPSSYGLAGTHHPQQSEPKTGRGRPKRQNIEQQVTDLTASGSGEDQDGCWDQDGSPADKNPVFGISNLDGDVDLKLLFPQGVLSDMKTSPTSSKLLFLQSSPSPYTSG